MAIIQHYIDLPSDWERLKPCIHIRGWCFALDKSPIHGIRLLSQDQFIYGEIGKSRPDVKSSFPDAPDDFTGFDIQGILPSGQRILSIEVRLNDGTWQLIFSRPVKVHRRLLPLWLGGGDWAELTFLQVSCRQQYAPRTLEADKFPNPAFAQSLWPKLSIVTPSLQQAHFIAETLRGVIQQTKINCAYIVQDGGSTDGSIEIVRSFAEGRGGFNEQDDGAKAKSNNPSSSAHATQAERNLQNSSLSSNPRITAWASEPDTGQAEAIMRGFAKTSGEPADLMAWINSDDFYLPGSLAFVVDFFAKNPDVDVIYGHRVLVNEVSQEIGRWFLAPHDDEILKRYDFVPQETMFWRRRIWNKTSGLDTSLKFAMDWDLLLRFQAAGARIVRVPYFLACFRVHPAQKTSAQMETIGQREIDALRTRTFSRQVPAAETENDPVLLRYLRFSAWTKFLWNLGIRV